jgi:hypothetical protein
MIKDCGCKHSAQERGYPYSHLSRNRFSRDRAVNKCRIGYQMPLHINVDPYLKETHYEAQTSGVTARKSSLSKNYLPQASRYTSSKEKQREREKVLAYILASIPEEHKVSLLSLPGEHWIFENMLRNSRPGKVWCLGLEQHNQIIIKNAGRMTLVNDRKRVRLRELSYGSCKLAYARALASRWLNLKTSDFLTMFHDDLGQSRTQMRTFNNKFYKNNAVWLDFTSPICSEVVKCLENIGAALDPREQAHPFVVTIMYGRDKGISGGLEGRKDLLEKTCPRWKIEDYWSYVGLNKTRMATFCGIYSF